MGFDEDKFLGNLDRRKRQDTREAGDRRVETINSSIHTLIPKEYPEAKKLIESSAIDMGSFRDLYGDERVGADEKEVRRLRARFARADQRILPGGATQEQVHKLSVISESFLLRGLNEGDWVPYCGAIKTTEYDDFVNGVDLVLEYKKAEDPASHLGLAIDVTFSKDLERKLSKIKEEIAKGTLTRIKYFDSPNSHIRGELRGIPRGVVGFDTDTMNRISEYRKTYGEMPKNDPLRSVSFHQLSMQMRTFAEYAEEIGSPSLATLQRTNKFVELLTSYVKSKAPNFDKSVLESEQVSHLVKSLERFGKL